MKKIFTILAVISFCGLTGSSMAIEVNTAFQQIVQVIGVTNALLMSIVFLLLGVLWDKK